MKVAAGKRERERVFLILIKDPTKLDLRTEERDGCFGETGDLDR